MKQFTTAALFFVSLFAQSKAELKCNGDFSYSLANVPKCKEVISANNGNNALAPLEGNISVLSEPNNNCAIYTQGVATRSYLAKQAQWILDQCGAVDNYPISGRVTDFGNGHNPTCIISKGKYVIFFSVLVLWLKPSCVARTIRPVERTFQFFGYRTPYPCFVVHTSYSPECHIFNFADY